MRRTLVGTRFTTGCGHSWKRSRPRWTRQDLGDASTDCTVCGELLLIPREQFEGQDPEGYPAEVHCPRFHVELNRRDPRWPVDGNGTYVASIDEENLDIYAEEGLTPQEILG